MSKRSKSKSGSKFGYGLPNINRKKITKKDISIILKKRWKDVLFTRPGIVMEKSRKSQEK